MKKLLSLSFASVMASNLAHAAPSEIKIGERPAIEKHLDQTLIEEKKLSLKEIFEHGKLVFNARFNELDGQGRPATTGGGALRDSHGQPAFIRTSGPDSNSCSGCHSQPFSGGSGDFVANVFVLAQTLDPVTESVSSDFSNERNTLGMFGSGAIEALAIEMSRELISIREAAKREAQASGEFVTKPLTAKGVSFGSISVSPDGLVDPSQIEGVDWDLIVKPFHQKGAVVSLREFTNNAMNHHHGIQTVERFGEDTDLDGDFVLNELSIGDVTAAAVFQAMLPIPKQKLPYHPERKKAAKLGEMLFSDIGCSGCHIPSLELNSRFFVEPNPFNPRGNLQTSQVNEGLDWDMTEVGKLERLGEGAIVRAFTDLKRHNLCDEELIHFCNERIPQGSLVGFASEADFLISSEVRPVGDFLTRKLWDLSGSSPYGHRGDLTSITQAIYHHGGAARVERDRFFALDQSDQDRVVEFLRTLGASLD